MSERRPIAAVNCTDQWDDDARKPADPGQVMPWEDVRDRLAAARLFWSATNRPSGGAPHVRPVFAVWVDDALYSTTNDARAKARNLVADPHVTFTTTTEEVDLVVEGSAAFVTEAAALERIVEAYREKYGWPLSLRDGDLYAPFGAPAAGPPPYRPYAVTPNDVFAFGTNETFAPVSTHFRF